MSAGDVGAALKLWRCGFSRIRGFSGSLSALLGVSADRLGCRDIVVGVYDIAGFASSGIGGSGGFVNEPVVVLGAVIETAGESEFPDIEGAGGIVATVAALEEEVPE